MTAIVAGEKLAAATNPPDLRGYVDLALKGGFPEPALQLSDRNRQRWLDSYVDQLVTRDAQTIDDGRDPVRLGRFFEVYTLNSAGLADDKTIYDAAGINRKTALAYLRLFKNLMVVDELPAWTSNRLKRLIRSPKRYLIDPSLFSGTLGVDTTAVLQDGDLLGRLLDTFVAAQLRAQATVARTRTRLYHLRQEQGRHEIDIIVELSGQRVIGIEVKTTSSPSPHDAPSPRMVTKPARWPIRSRNGASHRPRPLPTRQPHHSGPDLNDVDVTIESSRLTIAALLGSAACSLSLRIRCC